MLCLTSIYYVRSFYHFSPCLASVSYLGLPINLLLCPTSISLLRLPTLFLLCLTYIFCPRLPTFLLSCPRLFTLLLPCLRSPTFSSPYFGSPSFLSPCPMRTLAVAKSSTFLMTYSMCISTTTRPLALLSPYSMPSPAPHLRSLAFRIFEQSLVVEL